ncbi:hypothetical protein KCMC57_up58370 [Kitasatospora sp. CMC57]|uniref:Uncharacterized protein n=1 Tax=Kitasatospora sp. CMC57 TaxID=3231513 RepID=A0AB33K3U2_9ACTN
MTALVEAVPEVVVLSPEEPQAVSTREPHATRAASIAGLRETVKVTSLPFGNLDGAGGCTAGQDVTTKSN